MNFGLADRTEIFSKPISWTAHSRAFNSFLFLRTGELSRGMIETGSCRALPAVIFVATTRFTKSLRRLSVVINGLASYDDRTSEKKNHSHTNGLSIIKKKSLFTSTVIKSFPRDFVRTPTGRDCIPF